MIEIPMIHADAPPPFPAPDSHEGVARRVADMRKQLAAGGTIEWLHPETNELVPVLGVGIQFNRLCVMIETGGRRKWHSVGGTFSFQWGPRK